MGMAFRRLSVACSLPLIALLSLPNQGCGTDARTISPEATIDPQLEDHLTILHWFPVGPQWDALSAAVDLFEDKHPGVWVLVNPDIAGPIPPPDGSPWTDLFPEIGREALADRVDAGHVTPLTDLAEAESWNSNFPSAVLETGTINGEIVGLPFNVERTNLLFSRTPLFRAAGLEPPDDLGEFMAACEVFEEAGVIPLALPAAGWTLGILAFDALLPELLGVKFYREFVSGKADLSGPELEVLLSAFERVLNCSNVSSASHRWPDEEETFRRGEAAMLVLGEWSAAYLEGEVDWEGNNVTPLKFNDDFTVRQAFGSSGHYVFNPATFSLASNARAPHAGREFLRFLASEEGQIAYYFAAEAVPVHTGVDVSSFPERVRLQSQDYQTAAAGDLLLRSYATSSNYEFYQRTIDLALLLFAVGGERACELDPIGIQPENCSEPARDLDVLLARLRNAHAFW